MTAILIVEDETNVRDTLALNLRAEGYEVATAADGEAGWAASRETQFDLIVLDVMLPGLDGLSVCRLIRKDSNVPIILLTARDLLLQKVWGYDYVGDSRTVDVHIRWLREKIEDDASQPKRITTVRGVGYRLEG